MSESVTAQLATLIAGVQHLNSRAEEERQERKAEKVETERTRQAVTAELNDIRHGQKDVIKRLDKIEPVTAMVTSWRSKMLGMGILVGFIGTVVTFAVVFFKELIVGWFQ